MKKLLLLSISIFTTSAFSQKEAITKDGKKVLLYENGYWAFANPEPINIKTTTIFKLEIPKIQPKETMVSHVGYTLSYNEAHEQANWVAYELTAGETVKIYERTNKFLRDPKIRTDTSMDKDFKGSGYDRGHLAPASDMAWSESAMKESFYYSNISPQTAHFNRGVWKKLEGLVRSWAIENKAVYVVTGPIFTKGLKTIGKNNVTVPEYYYKVILDYREPSIKGIGFILSNQSSSSQLKNQACPIDFVEEKTGIDFFAGLPDEQEKMIESELCVGCWSWDSSKSSVENEKLSTYVRCSGITKAGARCKRRTTSSNGRCYQHVILEFL